LCASAFSCCCCCSCPADPIELTRTTPTFQPMDRRAFLNRVGLTAAGLTLAPDVARALGSSIPRIGSSPGPSEFVFARLRYDSGDWDYNPKVCANVLDAVVQYTEIPVHQTEVVITADSAELQAFPFVFMTGHKLVR